MYVYKIMIKMIILPKKCNYVTITVTNEKYNIVTTNSLLRKK